MQGSEQVSGVRLIDDYLGLDLFDRHVTLAWRCILHLDQEIGLITILTVFWYIILIGKQRCDAHCAVFSRVSFQVT